MTEFANPIDRVLADIHYQMVRGKGQQRHGNDKLIYEQPAIKIPELLGDKQLYGPRFQILKKTLEVERLEPRAAYYETLGICGYGVVLACHYLRVLDGVTE